MTIIIVRLDPGGFGNVWEGFTLAQDDRLRVLSWTGRVHDGEPVEEAVGRLTAAQWAYAQERGLRLAEGRRVTPRPRSGRVSVERVVLDEDGTPLAAPGFCPEYCAEECQREQRTCESAHWRPIYR